MNFEQVVKKIPPDCRPAVTDRLVDVMLNSKNGEKLPSGLAKTILYYWQHDLLGEDMGTERLLEAVTTLEPDTALNVLNELGLAEAAATLKEAVGSAP